MARIITISIEKGGVGKTTTAVTLAHALVTLGFRVLLVDTDPQHNTTTYVGVADEGVSLSDVLLAPERVREAIVGSRAGGADLLPGSRETAIVMDELKSRHKSPYTVLRRVLEQVSGEYDYILVDTPRTMDLMSVSALAAATEVLAPIDCDPMAVAGLGLIRRSIRELAEAELLREEPRISVLLTKYEGSESDRSETTKDTVEYVRQLGGIEVYKTLIRYSKLAKKGFPAGRTVLDLFPRASVSADYMALAREVAHG